MQPPSWCQQPFQVSEGTCIVSAVDMDLQAVQLRQQVPHAVQAAHQERGVIIQVQAQRVQGWGQTAQRITPIVAA